MTWENFEHWNQNLYLKLGEVKYTFSFRKIDFEKKRNAEKKLLRIFFQCTEYIMSLKGIFSKFK